MCDFFDVLNNWAVNKWSFIIVIVVRKNNMKHPSALKVAFENVQCPWTFVPICHISGFKHKDIKYALGHSHEVEGNAYNLWTFFFFFLEINWNVGHEILFDPFPVRSANSLQMFSDDFGMIHCWPEWLMMINSPPVCNLVSIYMHLLYDGLRGLLEHWGANSIMKTR